MAVLKLAVEGLLSYFEVRRILDFRTGKSGGSHIREGLAAKGIG